MHKIIVPPLCKISGFEIWIVGFSYTRKEAEKDVGRFTIVFVAQLFTF